MAVLSKDAAVKDDAVVLGALGVLAYISSMMTHEALGHGAVCILAGGHNVAMTGWSEGCNLHPEPLAITTAGPAVQFGAGLLAWLVLRRLKPRRFANLRSFLWLYMVFDLLMSSGYVAYSGVTNFGDGAVIIAGLTPRFLWRGILILAGAVIYYLSMWAAALELRRFVGSDNNPRRLKRILWIPYLAAGAFACCAGALNRTEAPRLALELALISSFGAGFGIVRLPDLRHAMVLKVSVPGSHVRWSIAWVLAATAIGAIFMLTLGLGLGGRS